MIREYLSLMRAKNASTHTPVIPAEAAKYRKAAGATSLGECELVLLSACSWEKKDNADVEHPDNPQPTM